jgi:hypothetical protein
MGSKGIDTIKVGLNIYFGKKKTNEILKTGKEEDKSNADD